MSSFTEDETDNNCLRETILRIIENREADNKLKQISSDHGDAEAEAVNNNVTGLGLCQLRVNLIKMSPEALLKTAASPKRLRAYCQEQKQLVKRLRQTELLKFISHHNPISMPLPSIGLFQKDLEDLPDIFRNTQKKKAANCYKKEFIVEEILSLEERKTNPIFLVKWLNYKSSDNTWEPLANLNDCVLLKEFLEDQLIKFRPTILNISESIDVDVRDKQLSLEEAEKEIAAIENYQVISHLSDLVLLAQFKLSGSRSQSTIGKIRARVVQATIHMPYYFKRRKQLRDLLELKNDINAMEKGANINVENKVDFDVPHSNFCYINERMPQDDVVINNDPPIGCECEKCNYQATCCAKMSGQSFAYNQKNRLRIEAGMPIYECNKRCKCSMDCRNRLIQRGRKNSLCIFKTANGCGWGVKTEKVIYAGEYVCEYIGEVIRVEEANLRGEKYDAEGRTYLFDLDYTEDAQCLYTIDAARYGNVSRLINHSCAPNCGVWPAWVDCLDPYLPRLAIFSLRRIEAGEELTFDYINQNSINWNDNSSDSTETNLQYENMSTAEKVQCRCGAISCRKYLF